MIALQAIVLAFALLVFLAQFTAKGMAYSNGVVG